MDLTRLEEGISLEPDNQIIDTQYFEFPITLEANFGEPTSSINIAPDDPISDHLQ